MNKALSKLMGGVAAALMLAACAGGPNERSSGEVVDDTRILATAKGALVKDPELKASSVDVDVQRGAVTLTGTVRSEREREKLLKTIWGVNGVKSVQTNIKVVPPTP